MNRRILLDGLVRTVRGDRDYDATVQKLRDKGHIVFEHPPTDGMLMDMSDGIAEATDGCEVEPDGICPHGHKSWLMEMGMI